MLEQPKHTPGPWLVREIDESKSDIVLQDFERGQAIATISHWGDADRKADATLIAAAPELLAALVSAHALLSELSVPDHRYLVVTNAAAVIHKATHGE